MGGLMTMGQTGAGLAGILRSVVGGAGLGLLAMTTQATAIETGDLDALREKALAVMNADRAEHDLPPLSLEESLNAAAQAHAVEMIEEDYFAHVSPDGVSPQDRYLDEGGSRAKLVEENIARCSECPLPPGEERVESFEQGWMNSPGHRRNILAEGLETFGFGIAGEDGRIVAVQTFAGPGTSPAHGPDQSAEAVPEAQRSEELIALLNRARERQGLSGLKSNETLAQTAQALLPESPDDILEQDGEQDLFAALPEAARNDWRSLRVVSAGCGGCGTEITDSDLHFFKDQWLDNPQFASAIRSERFGQAGAAFLSNGDGAKRAILVLGVER
ncbi:CAP domain-containing protein [Jiella marina]|uniref:CAP domain-containing protein n=1 Tax=Jiella sp. LLJ827 TaxID=2917712 RepID=UPI002100AE1E|nr:CAP domain-containing protein [Jiella sp. LLJ827]MCQ0989148.1 CAP domain-containing protein [Jiella sp. LLJ827]